MRLAVPLSAKHRKGTRVVSEEYDLQITRSLISQSCFLNSTEMEEMDEEDACFEVYRTPPHTPVPEDIMATEPVEWAWDIYTKCTESRESTVIVKKYHFEILMNLHELDLPQSEKTIFKITSVSEAITESA
ncbi:hypothetical protein AVEN_109022-1 [Araneus ventricosus]|uniref:Uncharacterized protein n=1 Tax=Araneus ventricosus TaxID=182803 RepID=A0A4Y2HND4_ARAVE|nr:hypothetical protein AVEN_109022-1 [Araneus ventricosus]